MGILSGIGKVFSALAPVASVVSPIAGAAASLVGAIGSNKAQKDANEQNLQIARENNQTSIQIARENNEFAKQHAIDMFNMENAYNTPLAQMERFREAGLNPAVMMEGVGSAASGNSSGAGMVSPSMPTLTTPHMEAVPPMAMGFLDALSNISQIKLTNAQARKAGAETSRIDEMLPEEIANLGADTKSKEAQAAYTNLLRDIEAVYGRAERGMKLKNMAADFALALAKGETEKAQKLFYDAEKQLTDTKNANEKQQAPIILENLKKTGRAIDASAAASRASAEESRAGAAVKWKEADIREIDRRMLEAQEGDIIFARRLENAKNFRELGEMVVTFEYRLEALRKANLISEQQLQEAKAKARMAEKENDWYHWNQFLHTLETINNGVTAYIPLTSERTTTKKSGYDYIRGDYTEHNTVTHSKKMPWQK